VSSLPEYASMIESEKSELMINNPKYDTQNGLRKEKKAQ